MPLYGLYGQAAHMCPSQHARSMRPPPALPGWLTTWGRTGTVTKTGSSAAVHGTVMLHLTHMEMIGVRDLQQHASAALRRVAKGESLGVTYRGRMVAVLVPPSAAGGMAAVIAAGRVQPARTPPTALPDPVTAPVPSEQVLDDLRSER